MTLTLALGDKTGVEPGVGFPPLNHLVNLRHAVAVQVQVVEVVVELGRVEEVHG